VIWPSIRDWQQQSQQKFDWPTRDTHIKKEDDRRPPMYHVNRSSAGAIQRQMAAHKKKYRKRANRQFNNRPLDLTTNGCGPVSGWPRTTAFMISARASSRFHRCSSDAYLRKLKKKINETTKQRATISVSKDTDVKNAPPKPKNIKKSRKYHIRCARRVVQVILGGIQQRVQPLNLGRAAEEIDRRCKLAGAGYFSR
jgi:transketolase